MKLSNRATRGECTYKLLRLKMQASPRILHRVFGQDVIQVSEAVLEAAMMKSMSPVLEHL